MTRGPERGRRQRRSRPALSRPRAATERRDALQSREWCTCHVRTPLSIQQCVSRALRGGGRGNKRNLLLSFHRRAELSSQLQTSGTQAKRRLWVLWVLELCSVCSCLPYLTCTLPGLDVSRARHARRCGHTDRGRRDSNSNSLGLRAENLWESRDEITQTCISHASGGSSTPQRECAAAATLPRSRGASGGDTPSARLGEEASHSASQPHRVRLGLRRERAQLALGAVCRARTVEEVARAVGLTGPRLGLGLGLVARAGGLTGPRSGLGLGLVARAGGLQLLEGDTLGDEGAGRAKQREGGVDLLGLGRLRSGRALRSPQISPDLPRSRSPALWASAARGRA